jgi:HD-GYP domain-containing protein (c-di-GMP phosphodiesterase class II)
MERLSSWSRGTASCGWRSRASSRCRVARPGGDDGGEEWGVAVLPTLRHATDRVITSHDVHTDANEDFSALVEFDRRTGYRSQSFMSVPLRNHENELLGVVLAINAQSRATGAVVPFSEKDQRLMESLASQAAVAITKNRLVRDFKGLFEGLTDLISTAIDEQSPHTGGHVRRVVVLSTMIAEAMSRSADATVRKQALSEEQLYELRIAALLHDCGKLTTPVHLTDKATKLQGIVDRMWLIEARAETARRQFRLELLHDLLRRLPNGDGRERRELDDKAADFDRQLEQDLDVLRRCNQGVEQMPDHLWEQVRAIGERYGWTSVRGERESLVSSDELYHLGTRSGTLSREERVIVQGHVLSTMRMLERLPYPKSLRNVPVYAAAHHERINGDGYPLQLAGDEIPIQGRIIAIADVFEALTAKDRPYRRAMTLPEAMQMLGDLAQSGAVDEGLYNLIVSEGIHRRYAAEYDHPAASAN